MKITYGNSTSMETSHGNIIRPNMEIQEIRDLLRHGQAKFTFACQYGMHLNVYLNHYDDVKYKKMGDTVKFTMEAVDGTLVTIQDCPVRMVGEYEVWKAFWTKHEKKLTFKLLGSARDLKEIDTLVEDLLQLVDENEPMYVHVDPDDIDLENLHYYAREVYSYRGEPYMLRIKYHDNEGLDRSIEWVGSCSGTGKYELDFDALADLAINNAVRHE